jgi:hypothetical protein
MIYIYKKNIIIVGKTNMYSNCISTMSLNVKNSFATHVLIFGLIEKLTILIKKHENYLDLKMNPKLVISCLKLINDTINNDSTLNLKQKKKKKSEIILQALGSVLNLSDEEINLIEKQINLALD